MKVVTKAQILNSPEKGVIKNRNVSNFIREFNFWPLFHCTSYCNDNKSIKNVTNLLQYILVNFYMKYLKKKILNFNLKFSK